MNKAEAMQSLEHKDKQSVEAKDPVDSDAEEEDDADTDDMTLMQNLNRTQLKRVPRSMRNMMNCRKGGI
ncbi:hypothetical protein C1H46_005614 [Malus baccata]|uniref:Uncharacterized protein n=1 Tax=Malus baccata TaxID=106549 RepID=A0A540NCL2_MALBA|nr:hypothetical protein C1H46_005614 [Malus baccata]